MQYVDIHVHILKEATTFKKKIMNSNGGFIQPGHKKAQTILLTVELNQGSSGSKALSTEL